MNPSRVAFSTTSKNWPVTINDAATALHSIRVRETSNKKDRRPAQSTGPVVSKPPTPRKGVSYSGQLSSR